MKNGFMWKDTQGKDIQAHGGCIIQHNGIYYWYGENKGIDNVPGKDRTDVIGVSCYSSDDLCNWKYEGLVLKADNENPESPIHTTKVLERPKVIYNEKTNQFVMWMHIDDASYTLAAAGVAISDTPTGPFEFIRATQPNRQDCRDMTIFRDNDGKAYLIHSKDWNKTLNIARLNDDFTSTDGFYVSVMQDQEREAPAICYHNKMYYMITSGCTGWKYNAALFARCPSLLGKWKLIDNPCEGKNYRNTFCGQSSYIFNVNGNDYLMLDHWKPYNLKESGYSILPIIYDDKNNMTVLWQEEWNGI